MQPVQPVRGFLADPARVVTGMLATFAGVEFVGGSVLLAVGFLHSSVPFWAGGCVLYVVAARTWLRLRAGRRLAAASAPPIRQVPGEERAAVSAAGADGAEAVARDVEREPRNPRSPER